MTESTAERAAIDSEGQLITFESDSEEVTLEVASFVMREGLSTVGEWRVVGYTDLSPSDLADALLGRGATLKHSLGATPRSFRGVVLGVEVQGARKAPGSTAMSVALTLAPKLALLRSRTTSRVFQEKTTRQIVETLLDEWKIPHRWSLASDSQLWDYCVQHRESDYEFLCRVVAADGVFFFFEDAPPTATDGWCVVFGDSPAAYGRVDPLTALGYANDTLIGAANRGRVSRFVEHRGLRPHSVTVRDYGAGQANLDRVAHDAASSTPGPVDPPDLTVSDRAPFADLRTVYEFQPAHGVSKSGATTALHQHRQGARRFEGEGSASELRPGFLFAVTQHDEASLDGVYVATELVTRGFDPRYRARSSDGERDETLRQEIRAMLATDAHHPPRLAAPTYQGLDTATVVGPPDQPTYADGLGRVRVRFHWDQDRQSVPPPKDWQEHSTWIRVAQPWNGSGHGAFFLPRVGSEVIVGYVGADINRPVVLGCLPNSTTPQPFSLPAESGLTGIVSRSLGGEGRSELVFDDSAGMEAARFTSQRQMSIVAKQDLSQKVGRNSVTEVEDLARLRAKRSEEEYEGTRDVRVGGASSLDVGGAAKLKVTGHTSVESATMGLAAHGEVSLHFDRDAEWNHEQDLRVRVAGTTSMRHEETLLVTVGEAGRPAGHVLHVEGRSTHESSGPLELASAESITLRCHDTILTLTKDAIQLRAPKLRVDADAIELVGKKVHLTGSDFVRTEGRKLLMLSAGASVCLTTVAKVHGSAVKLGAPPDALDGPEAKKALDPPTRIQLRDQDGRPVAGERFIVRLADGTTRAGVTDAAGDAWIEGLRGACTVDFIDLSDWRKS